jgi:hypothetical protein
MVLSSEQIEHRCERMFDRIDARLMRGEYSQAEYDRLAKEINEWCEMQYRIRERCQRLIGE